VTALALGFDESSKLLLGAKQSYPCREIGKENIAAGRGLSNENGVFDTQLH
jgi:hypothetical protein